MLASPASLAGFRESGKSMCVIRVGKDLDFAHSVPGLCSVPLSTRLEFCTIADPAIARIRQTHLDCRTQDQECLSLELQTS